METPKTIAGELTERIMELVTRKWGPMGKITTQQYNRIYEAVLECLISAEESGNLKRK